MTILLFRKAPEKGGGRVLEARKKTTGDGDITVGYFIRTSLHHFIPSPVIRSVLTGLPPCFEHPNFLLFLLVSKPSFVGWPSCISPQATYHHGNFPLSNSYILKGTVVCSYIQHPKFSTIPHLVFTHRVCETVLLYSPLWPGTDRNPSASAS